MVEMGVNGNKSVGINKTETGIFFDNVVRSPGFEPGSSAWEADVLTKLD